MLDLLLSDIIDSKSYQTKKEYLDKKIENIDKELQSLELVIEDDESIEDGLKKFADLLNTDIVLEEFDKEIFDSLIDYIIVGGFDENGNIDPYLLRFVCKTDFAITRIKSIDKEKVLNENISNNIYKSDNKVLLDFISRQKIISFEKNEAGKIKKNIISKVRVKVELDIKEK